MTKDEILEEAATEITCQLCLSIYPEDIEKYYETGMTVKNLIAKVLQNFGRP